MNILFMISGQKSRKEMKTICEIQKYFPCMSMEKIEEVDRNIKKSIANDDSYDSIKLYVQRELKGKKVKKKYSFWVACTAIADQYHKNNKKWMCQENLFCFFALIISIVSMLFAFMEHFTGNEDWTSNTVQFLLYFSALILFKFVEIKGWVYKNKQFNKFLEILNRNAPLLIMMCCASFYFLAIVFEESYLQYVGMVFSAIFPIFAIIKTIKQM